MVPGVDPKLPFGVKVDVMLIDRDFFSKRDPYATAKIFCYLSCWVSDVDKKYFYSCFPIAFTSPPAKTRF